MLLHNSVHRFAKGFPNMKTSIIPKLHQSNNVFTDRVLQERYDDGQTESGGAGQPLYRDTPDCDCFDKKRFEESENVNMHEASV